jgi:DNA-binding transcriptional LysR family regulator
MVRDELSVLSAFLMVAVERSFTKAAKRLAVSPSALSHAIRGFAREYPDVAIDLTTTLEGRVDLVGAGFDAGIHLGEYIQRDMVAVRASPSTDS